MAQNYDKIDLFFNSRGDYSNSFEGDLLDTSGDPLRSVFQEIETRAKSSLEDWSIYPTLGASLEDYVGEPNNKVTAEAIKIRLISSLVRDSFIRESDLKIAYLVPDIDRIIFRLTLKVEPTVQNGNSQYLSVRLLYNYTENNICVVP